MLNFKILFFLIIFITNLFSQQDVYIPNSNNLNNFSDKNNNLTNTKKTKTTYKIDDKELGQNQKLTELILDNAVENQLWDMVEHIIPIYSRFKEKDSILLLYAIARLSQSNKNYNWAIKKYRQILTKDKNLSPIRLYLIECLIENKQFKKAIEEIDFLVKDESLPKEILNRINFYKKYINENDTYKFNFGMNYIADKNINETSNDKYVKIGDTLLERDDNSLPQSGKGISYNFGFDKQFEIAEQNNFVVNIQNNGKRYFDQKDFNDHIIRLSSGYRFQDGKKTINILPFYQERYFSNKKYNYTYGNLINSDMIITNRFKILPFFEYGRNYHEDRLFLDAYYFYSGLGSNLYVDDKTILFDEINIYQNVAKESSESFLRKNVKIGIYRNLPLDFSTQVSFSFANKLYDNDKNLYNIRREELEYNTSLSIWNKKVVFFKFLPKINIEYEKVDSNVNIFSYNKNQYYLSIEKSF